MPAADVLIFAGMAQGEALLELLTQAKIPAALLTVAEFEKIAAAKAGEKNVAAGTLPQLEIEAQILEKGCSLVVDAACSYGAEASRQMQAACKALGVAYYRLNQWEWEGSMPEFCVSFPSVPAAAAFFSKEEGNILAHLECGELGALTQIPDFQKRVYAKIPPEPQAITACNALGLQSDHLVCIPGAPSCEMKTALLKQYRCRYLLVKGGGAAGFFEAAQAAKAAGARLVTVGGLEQEDCCGRRIRPQEEVNSTLPVSLRHSHFPLFIPTNGKTALVVGGGAVAARRVAALRRFCWNIRVVSPQAVEELQALCRQGALRWEKRAFHTCDLDGVFLAVAATCSREVNRLVGEEAKKRGVAVSVADCKAECSFYFPAVAERGRVVAGICGDGNNHFAVAQAARLVRRAWEDEN